MTRIEEYSDPWHEGLRSSPRNEASIVTRSLPHVPRRRIYLDDDPAPSSARLGMPGRPGGDGP